MIEKIKESLNNMKRVLIVSSKPSKDEFMSTAKVCAAGIGVIGIVGFALYLVSILLIG